MTEELKSALELAMEKLERESGGPPARLSREQREKIAEVRSRFKAKIAEAEIAAQARTRVERDPETIRTVKAGLVEQRLKLERQMESEVEKVRRSGT